MYSSVIYTRSKHRPNKTSFTSINMSRLAVYCVLVLFVGLAVADEKYTDKYDNIDLDAILTNDRLLQKYKECLLADGDDTCNEEGKTLKRVMGEALANDCAKCTEKQKSGAKKSISFLSNDKPDIWEELVNKFDPNGEYRKKHPEYKDKQ